MSAILYILLALVLINVLFDDKDYDYDKEDSREATRFHDYISNLNKQR
jgi:hypothetical protein